MLTSKLQTYEEELERHRIELQQVQMERDRALQMVQAAEERDAVRLQCEKARSREIELRSQGKGQVKYMVNIHNFSNIQ